MGATRTYGIPRIIESSELFSFNDGKGTLRIKFTGGIPDPKFKIPATYSTASTFEQIVIESSPMFGKKIYRYNARGQAEKTPMLDIIADAKADAAEVDGRKRKNAKAPAPVAATKVFANVETVGQATEVLLDMGVPADELGTADAVVSVMMREKVSFPNLKFD